MQSVMLHFCSSKTSRVLANENILAFISGVHLLRDSVKTSNTLTKLYHLNVQIVNKDVTFHCFLQKKMLQTRDQIRTLDLLYFFYLQIYCKTSLV